MRTCCSFLLQVPHFCPISKAIVIVKQYDVSVCVSDAGDIYLWPARELYQRMQGNPASHAAGVGQQQSRVCRGYLLRNIVCRVILACD